ncbi:hypothetical protein V502_02399 [Pseudogymnoascus sp. VKM F-4520 (FW-2644)]|nr:hypothetical protein V502_02399 [Pseudogymnoascus sp. VKM F-4520 (FW-2644)]
MSYALKNDNGQLSSASSTRTLQRELQRQFSYHRGQLQIELHSHIKRGGRISITTDAWSARNYTDYAAITAHWINNKWQQKTRVLDIVHLKEPIHSGEYLAQQLAIVTNDIDALKTLKAAPAKQTESYRCEQGAARIPLSFDSNIEVKNTLGKVRRHIYVFRNRRQWKDALQKQTIAAGLKKLQLSLDMPVRWNSTYEMVTTAIKLQTPITAICATQQMDLSMRDIALTPEDWALQKEVGISSTIGLACIAAHKKLNEYYTLAANQRWTFGQAVQKKDRQYYLDEEKKEAEAEVPQLPTEPDSDDDLYISHSIYQEPEWKRWLVEPRPGLTTYILKYWAAKQYQYPIVAAIARDHLAIPATSAPSERGHILEVEDSEAKDADDERED